MVKLGFRLFVLAAVIAFGGGVYRMMQGRGFDVMPLAMGVVLAGMALFIRSQTQGSSRE
jgi:hypothetical protein